MRASLLIGSTAIALAAAGPAAAQTSPDQPPAAPAVTPICTDRPTKANVPCTVPAGDFQIESDIANRSRSAADGVTQTTLLVANPTYKYGVSKTLDVELNIAVWDEVRTTAGEFSNVDGSLGDTFVRAKWALISGTAFSLSLIPFVKLPTARHDVGNGHVEGGLIAPMSYNLPAKFVLTLGPELDALENPDRTGVHANLINVVNLARPFGKWTLYAELWNDQNFFPSGTVAQTTADFAAAYLLNSTLQLDVGANLGLDRAAPQQQYYFGVSHRF